MHGRPDVPSPNLILSLSFEGCRRTLAVAGELDIATLPLLRSAVEALAGHGDLVVDLGQVSFIGIRALGWLNDHTAGVDVRGLSARAEDVCRRSRLHRLVDAPARPVTPRSQLEPATPPRQGNG